MSLRYFLPTKLLSGKNFVVECLKSTLFTNHSYQQITIEEQQPRLHCAFNDLKLYNRKAALSLILVRSLVGFLGLPPVPRVLTTEVALEKENWL